MEDPGWPPLLPTLLGTLLPGRAVRRSARAADGLIALRSIFVSFSLALGLIFVVCLVVSSGMEASVSPLVAAIAVLAWSVATHVLVGVLARPLTCDDDQRLADSYRTRFFLRIACYESGALAGFVAVILTGQPLIYLIGAASAAVGFAASAPTRANLEREQQALSLAGCPRSLVAALRTPPTRR